MTSMPCLCFMQIANHAFEFSHGFLRSVGLSVGHFWSEEPQRVVAPIVRQLAVVEEFILDEMVHG